MHRAVLLEFSPENALVVPPTPPVSPEVKPSMPAPGSPVITVPQSGPDQGKGGMLGPRSKLDPMPLKKGETISGIKETDLRNL